MKVGIITPIGPGHKEVYTICESSIKNAWDYNPGRFDEIEIIAMWDLEGQYGRSSRRNAGIDQALKTGCDWLFFLDADDLLCQTAFIDVADYMDNYDAVWGNICEMPYGKFEELKVRDGQLQYTENYHDLLVNDPFYTLQMGHFVRTKCADAVRFDTTKHVGEDFKYYLQLCEKYRFIKTTKIFFINQRGCHSTGPLSATGSSWDIASMVEILKAMTRQPEFESARNGIYETVSVMYQSGLIDVATLQQFNKLCQIPEEKQCLEVSNSTHKPISAEQGIEEKFTQIYDGQSWGGGEGETVSGSGSTLRYTQNLREKLPDLFSAFDIQSVFDGPCGDFNWMQHVLKTYDLQYTGGDVVEKMIMDNNNKFASPRIKFIHLDLTKDPYPSADLMICRDCLFHLSFSDIKRVLQNFIKSGIPYLLTTTHIKPDTFQNQDIITGGFREINLLSAPFFFPKEVLYKIDDWVAPHPERAMCLWHREQIGHVLDRIMTVPD